LCAAAGRPRSGPAPFAHPRFPSPGRLRAPRRRAIDVGRHRRVDLVDRNALTELIPGIPCRISAVPIVIVQHMPPLFYAPARGNVLKCTCTARGAGRQGKGPKLRRGQVWIAPGGQHIDSGSQGEWNSLLGPQPGSSGKFLPPRGGCVVPLGGPNLRCERAGGGAYPAWGRTALVGSARSYGKRAGRSSSRTKRPRWFGGMPGSVV